MGEGMLTEEQITTAAAVAKAALLAQGATLGFDEKTAAAAATSLAATLRVANKQAADLATTPLLRDDVVFGYVLTNVVAQQVAALTALVGKLLARLPNAKDDPEVAALLAGALTPEKVVERAREDMPAQTFGPIEKCGGCQRSAPVACFHHARCQACREAARFCKPGRPWREFYCPEHRA